MTASGSVTVVVPTCNRAAFLPELVHALRQQTTAGMHVVIVDDGSSDGSADVALAAIADDRRFTVLPVANRGPAAARNAAIAATSSEWLAFTDDDCLPQPGWLDALLAPAQPGIDIVQGRTVSDPRARLREMPWFTRGKDIERWSNRFQMCNLLVRRRAFEAVGGLDERFPPRGFGEDTDLGLRIVRAGGRTAFAPEAVVHHRVLAMTFPDFLRRRYRWAEVVRVVALNPDGRQTFRHPYVAHRSHVALWMALPVSAAALAAGWWLVPTAGLAAFVAHRAHTSRREGRPLATRIARAPLELIGVAVEAWGFLVQSVRQRRLLL